MGKNEFTPSEFLQHLKTSEALYFDGQKPSRDFVDIHAQDLEKLGLSEVDPEKWLDVHFNELFSLISHTVSEPTKLELLASVAVGCVDTYEVNACIVRSRCGSVFAILVNRALLTMLNHHVKLISAANYPSSVLYFEGFPVTSLAGNIYSRASTAMLKHYYATGKPIGPELKLNLNSPAMKFVDQVLISLHTFVLAHEVGHFVNGDLELEINFTGNIGLSECGMVFGANVSHEMEFAADQFAFETLLRVLRARGVSMSARRVLDLSVTLFFNFLRDISNRGSESHPTPSDRVLSVTCEFFGAEAAYLMKRSFNDLSIIAEFRDHVGDISISELLDARSLT